MASVFDSWKPTKTATPTTAPTSRSVFDSWKPAVGSAVEIAQTNAARDKSIKINKLNTILQSGDTMKIYPALQAARDEGLINKEQQLGTLVNIGKAVEEQGKQSVKDATSFPSIAMELGKNISNIPATIMSAYTTAGTGFGEGIADATGLNAQMQQSYSSSQKSNQEALTALVKARKSATSQEAKDRLTQAINDVTQRQQQTYADRINRLNEIVYNVDPIRNAAAIAEIGMDIITAGQLVGAKDAAKIGLKSGQLFTNSLAKSLASISAKGLAKGASKTALGVVAENAVKQGLPGMLAGALSAIEQKGSETTPQDIFVGATTGGVMGAGMGVLSGARTAKQISKLEQAMTKAKLGKEIMPNLTDAQFSKFGPQKIAVAGDNVAESIGVKVSKNLSDPEYAKAFDKLNKEYLKETKTLESMPPVKQKIMQDAIDKRYQVKLAQLDEKVTQTITPKVESPTKIAKQPKVIAPQESSVPQVTKTDIPNYNMKGDAQSAAKDTRAKAMRAYNDKPQVTKTLDTTVKTPVGEQKVAGSALQTQAGIGQELGEKSTYTVESYKANKVTMDDLARNNKSEAIKVVNDTVDTTPAQRQEAYKALDKLAKDTNDVDLAQQLASSKAPTELSEAAQALGQRGYDLDPTSPADALRAIRKDVSKKIEARTKGTFAEATAKEIKKITASVKAPTRQDWASFIDGLRCN